MRMRRKRCVAGSPQPKAPISAKTPSMNANAARMKTKANAVATGHAKASMPKSTAKAPRSVRIHQFCFSCAIMASPCLGLAAPAAHEAQVIQQREQRLRRRGDVCECGGIEHFPRACDFLGADEHAVCGEHLHGAIARIEFDRQRQDREYDGCGEEDDAYPHEVHVGKHPSDNKKQGADP